MESLEKILIRLDSTSRLFFIGLYQLLTQNTSATDDSPRIMSIHNQADDKESFYYNKLRENIRGARKEGLMTGRYDHYLDCLNGTKKELNI